jgi:hypothetical protein
MILAMVEVCEWSFLISREQKHLHVRHEISGVTIRDGSKIRVISANTKTDYYRILAQRIQNQFPTGVPRYLG